MRGYYLVAIKFVWDDKNVLEIHRVIVLNATELYTNTQKGLKPLKSQS